MIRITLVLLLSFSMFASEAGGKRGKKTLDARTASLTTCKWTPPRLNPGENPGTYTLTLRPVISHKGVPVSYETCADAQRRKQKEWTALTTCTWTSPRLNPGENPVTYTLTLRQIGSNPGGPVYEACAEAQRRKQKEWLAQNIKPKMTIDAKPIVDVGIYPTSCTTTPDGEVCNSCKEKSIPATAGSFTDLITHRDAGTSSGPIQIIGRTHTCKVKNNKRVCIFCSKWKKKPEIRGVHTQAGSGTRCSKPTGSNKRVCETCRKQMIPATAVCSFADSITGQYGPVGNLEPQQIIRLSQNCHQINNHQKVCSVCTTWEERTVELNVEHTCRNDSDCTLVYTTCCGCDLGEKALAAVHVNDKDHYYKNLQDRLSCERNCHSIGLNNRDGVSQECNRVAVCVNGSCRANKITNTRSVSGGGGSEATQ